MTLTLTVKRVIYKKPIKGIELRLAFAPLKSKFQGTFVT